MARPDETADDTSDHRADMAFAETRAAAEAWLAVDPDPDTRAELAGLLTLAESGDSDAVSDLRSRFDGVLEFGTAGLRGALGAGSARMNRVVVIRAAAGLAAYLSRNGLGGGRVVVGYDARHKSDVFAIDTAAVMAGAGFQAVVLPEPLPTPLLAFAIRTLECVAGVMVTASHNPAADNGYKVYLGDGSQIVPPADEEISADIAAVAGIGAVPRSDGWTRADHTIVERYLDRVAGLIDPAGPRDLRVVYTPMHGVGGPLVTEALARTGFAPPIVVPDQAEPDPDFPTVAFPNPEEPGALDSAYRTAAEAAARDGDVDLVLANDPDADRCAVAVPDPGAEGGWRRLTGDEVGALLAIHLLDSHSRTPDATRRTMATTIVSSSLLSAIAERRGVPYAETLTGFKWLARVPGLAFGYEEALGYCVDPDAVADKDGISALLRIAELAAVCRSSGRTLLNMLDDIAREYGVYATEQASFRFTDVAEMDAIVQRLLAEPPTTIGGRAVDRVDDLSRPTGDLPPTTGVRFHLADGGRVVVRPSGTEPKLKTYLEVVSPVRDGDVTAARRAATVALTAIATDLTDLLPV